MLAASLSTIAFNSPAQPPETPTPTATAEAPIVESIGHFLVDQWRMETVWDCGGTVNRCMHTESESLVLARVAMGEAPDSLSDRVFIMWSIKMNAALGFKEALPGWRRPDDHWGPPTSIHIEALCNGGCQYSPVRVAEQIFFPCALSEYHALRGMLCPTDEQLLDFHGTYVFADHILQMGFDYFPEELKGYEHFRSPTIDGVGRFHREGGARSRIFFPGGNVWRDEYPEDDLFWERWELPTKTPQPTATATASPVATRTLRPTSTATSTVTLTPVPVFATLEPDPPVSGGTTGGTTMFAFDPALAPIVIYLVTAGIKSVFGRISGYGSMVVAAGVASLLLFGESIIGGLGPQAAEVATSFVQLLLVIASGFGLHDVVKSEIGKRV